MCEILQLLEVVTGKGDPIGSVAQPPHVVLDLLDELMRLFVRIGVVVAQVASSAVSYGGFEVDTD